MGKKMGINTKAVEARERKEAQKRVKNEAIERRKEDEFWRDNDKHVNRKIDRQREKEIRAQEERERKAANRAAYELDMDSAEKSAKAKATKHQPVTEPKVSRHEIQKSLEEEQKQLSKQLKKVNLSQVPLVPNLNRLDEGENASSIDQALDLLNPNGKPSTDPVSSSLHKSNVKRK